jgi:hypothetical protein
MRRLWLIFAQTVTIGLAACFVVAIFRPEWSASLPWFSTPVRPPAAPVAADPPSEPVPPAVESPQHAARPEFHSFRDGARKALPSVVHIFTSQK